jgi:hypothetical protein
MQSCCASLSFSTSNICIYTYAIMLRFSLILNFQYLYLYLYNHVARTEKGECEVDVSSAPHSEADPSLRVVHRPYVCGVPGCNKRYLNLNGLKYHGKHHHPGLDFRAEVMRLEQGPGMTMVGAGVADEVSAGGGSRKARKRGVESSARKEYEEYEEMAEAEGQMDDGVIMGVGNMEAIEAQMNAYYNNGMKEE